MQIEVGIEAASKSRKSKKANGSIDDKVVNSRRTRRQSQLSENIVEEIAKDKKEEDIPIPKKESRRAAKGAKKEKTESARTAKRKADCEFVRFTYMIIF